MLQVMLNPALLSPKEWNPVGSAKCFVKTALHTSPVWQCTHHMPGNAHNNCRPITHWHEAAMSGPSTHMTCTPGNLFHPRDVHPWQLKPAARGNYCSCNRPKSSCHKGLYCWKKVLAESVGHRMSQGDRPQLMYRQPV